MDKLHITIPREQFSGSSNTNVVLNSMEKVLTSKYGEFKKIDTLNSIIYKSK